MSEFKGQVRHQGRFYQHQVCCAEDFKPGEFTEGEEGEDFFSKQSKQKYLYAVVCLDAHGGPSLDGWAKNEDEAQKKLARLDRDGYQGEIVHLS